MGGFGGSLLCEWSGLGLLSGRHATAGRRGHHDRFDRRAGRRVAAYGPSLRWASHTRTSTQRRPPWLTPQYGGLNEASDPERELLRRTIRQCGHGDERVTDSTRRTPLAASGPAPTQCLRIPALTAPR